MNVLLLLYHRTGCHPWYCVLAQVWYTYHTSLKEVESTGVEGISTGLLVYGGGVSYHHSF